MKKILIGLIMGILPQSVLAQLGKIEEVTGLIVFAENDTIPQEVVFFPLKDFRDSSLQHLVSAAVEENDKTGIIIYFQGLRWMHDDLLGELNKARRIKGTLKDQQLYHSTSSVNILLVTLAFERVPLYGKDKQDAPTPGELTVEDKKYDIKLVDCPKETGYLMFLKIVK